MKSLKAVLLTLLSVAGLSSGAACWAGTVIVRNACAGPIGFSLSDNGAGIDTNALGVGQSAVYNTGSGAHAMALDAWLVSAGSGTKQTSVTFDGGAFARIAVYESGGVVGFVYSQAGSGEREPGVSSVGGVDTFTVLLACLLAGGCVWAFRSGIRDGGAR